MNGRTLTLILANSLLIASVCAVNLCRPPYSTETEFWLKCLAWIFIFSVSWMLVSWRFHVGTLFAPFPLFLMAAIVFNGGQVALWGLGLLDEGMLSLGDFDTRHLERTVSYVTMGLLAFHSGGLLVAGRKANARQLIVAEQYVLRSMRLVGLSLLFVSLPFWILTQIDLLRASVTGGYSVLYQQDQYIGIAGYRTQLALWFIPSLLLLVVGFRKSKRVLILCTGLVAIYAISNFALGYRSYSAWPVLAYVWVVNTAVRKLPRLPLAVGASVMIFVIFPLIKATRGLSGSSRTSLSSLWESYLQIDSPAVEIIKEMGGSMITVAYTLLLIPSEKPYENGAGYAFAATSAFPNVFGNGVHPAIAHGTPSDWLIWRVDPWVAERGGGLGFSFIAEAYYNFGWTLGLLALWTIGAAMSFFFLRLLLPWGLLGVSMAGTSLAFLTHFARGELYSIVRPTVWYVLIPALIVLLLASSLQLRSSSSIAPRSESGPGTSGSQRRVTLPLQTRLYR